MSETSDALLKKGCEKLKCDRTYVLEIADAVAEVMGTSDETVCVGMALQITAAGGLEKHAATMTPDSEWILNVYPKLREALNYPPMEVPNA